MRAGLPRGFVSAWDAWLSVVIPASQAVLGEAWLDAWMEAPVWRFALPPRQCGPDAVLGLWMPSVDRAGRHFPLTLATMAEDAGEAWLDRAEHAGRTALETDIGPDEVMALLDGALLQGPGAGGAPVRAAGMGVWWSEGGPRVPAASYDLATLPPGAMFTAMLAGGASQA